MPEIVRVILAVVVGGLLLAGFIGLPLYFLRRSMPAEVVRGIRFYFMPLRMGLFRPSWSAGFNHAYVERFVDEYARLMPAAYDTIGAKVSTADILAHLTKLRCHFTLGPVKSLVRSQVGLDDVNNDGKVDEFNGLTHNENMIEVGVIESRGMLTEGRMRTQFTAFGYELHNACIVRFCGVPLALAENFVSENDARLTPLLGGQSMKELKEKRKRLDDVFFALKAE